MNPRWRIYWLVGLVTLLASNISEAAESPPRIQWQKTFGGTNNEWLNVMVPTSDGGFILGGSSDSAASGNKTSTGYGGADFWIVKVDADGTKLWENTFGGLSDDILNSVEQTTDGGLILGGSSSSAVTGNKLAPHWGGVDYWVIKLDFNGQKRWDKSFGGSGDDQLYSVHQLPDGGYLLSGSSEFGVSGNKTNAGFGSLDLWVVKLDVDGNKVWEKSFGGADGEYFGNCVPVSDGGFVLAARSYSGVSGNKSSENFGSLDYWVVKLDSNANIVWDRSFGGNDAEELWSVQQTSDHGYILGGWSQSFPSGNKTSPLVYGPFGLGSDYWAIKLDANGNKTWEQSYGGDYIDDLFCAREAPGGFIMAGSSISGVSGAKTTANLGSWDWWVVKVDQNGDKIWDTSFGGTDSDFLSTAAALDNGYILAGSSSSSISGNKTAPNYGGSDFWIIKLEGPPRISAQPQSQSIAVGDPVSFAVLVNGASPLRYQWLFGGNPITGATNSTLTLFNTTYAQAGLYSVVVSNAFGTVTSSKAQLSFKFLSLKMYAGLTVDGQMGQNYRIEYIESLGPVTNWQALATVTLSNTPYLFIDVDSPKTPVRFYRALLLQ